MKEKKGRRLWGPMKGEPNERETSLRNLLQKPCLLAGTPRARKEGGKGRKKREREKGGNKGAPSYDASVQSRDTQGRRKVKKKRERREKREREREEGKGGGRG